MMVQKEMRWVCRCEGGWERQQLCCAGGTAGSTETGKGSSWSQPVPFVPQELPSSCLEHIPLSYCPFLGPCWHLQRFFKGQPELNTASASAKQGVCAGHSLLFTGTGMMETGPRSLNCPPLVVFLPDHVFRVASSLWKQQETDQVQLLLALLPVFPLVLDCIPEHSLQVWGCCCVCREYTWPWCYGFFWSCTNV